MIFSVGKDQPRGAIQRQRMILSTSRKGREKPNLDKKTNKLINANITNANESKDAFQVKDARSFRLPKIRLY